MSGKDALDPAVRKEQFEQMTVEEAVRAAQQRLIENKTTMKDNQKKFDKLMAHNDSKNLKTLEYEIKHLNRLNGINSKITRQLKEFARNKTKVAIKGHDGVV